MGQALRQSGVNSIEKVDGGYAKGYTHALTYWREIIDHLNALRNTRGMVVLLIAHSKVERFEDPESSPYDRYSPRLHKHAAALISEWCDAVLFATRKIRTQTEDAGFNRKRTIAHAIGKDGGERILRCVGGPSCVAKNRYGITEELPLSWAAFMNRPTLTNKLKEPNQMADLSGFDANNVEPAARLRTDSRGQVSGRHHRFGNEAQQGRHRHLPAADVSDHRR